MKAGAIFLLFPAKLYWDVFEFADAIFNEDKSKLLMHALIVLSVLAR